MDEINFRMAFGHLLRRYRVINMLTIEAKPFKPLNYHPLFLKKKHSLKAIEY